MSQSFYSVEGQPKAEKSSIKLCLLTLEQVWLSNQAGKSSYPSINQTMSLSSFRHVFVAHRIFQYLIQLFDPAQYCFEIHGELFACLVKVLTIGVVPIFDLLFPTVALFSFHKDTIAWQHYFCHYLDTLLVSA